MPKKNNRWILLLSIALILVISILIWAIIATKPMPVALLQNYGLDTLWDQGQVMNECSECHRGTDHHTCDTCHDDHGAVELSGIRFYEVVELTGDVPDPAFIRINAVMPDQANAGTHIKLTDLLSQYDIDNFSSVTFTTNDGGLTTIEAQYLDETALLVPYLDGVRFVTESVHVSTWLKGIKQIIVISEERPLLIDGQATSIGRLLTGDTVRLTVEGSDVMLLDEEGNTSHALVANRAEGALLLPLLENQNPDSVKVTLAGGDFTELTGDEIEGAVIAIVRGQVTLILPARGRSVWPADIIAIESN